MASRLLPLFLPAPADARTADVARSETILTVGKGYPVAAVGANAVWFDLIAPQRLRAMAAQPGSVWELTMQLAFTGTGAGKGVRCTINGSASGNIVGQVFPTATMLGWIGKVYFVVGNDGKNVTVMSQSMNNVLAPGAGIGTPFAPLTTGPITPALIDLSAESTLRIQTNPQNGDTAQLIFATLVRRTVSGGAISLFPDSAVACFGDSLTAGLNATTVGGYPTMMRNRAGGRGVMNLGIGGQNSTQIADRMIADRVMGRNGIIIAWMGRNDVGLVPSLRDTVMRNHERVVQNLVPGTTYMPGTITPAAGETDGTGGTTATANGVAIAEANAAIRARFPTTTVDFWTALATDPGHVIPLALRSDGTHLNEDGYVIAEATANTRLVALGK